jgi:hypothetical protein
MSSDTDNPRQRTVAELLAAHGDVSATTARRRRRREPDGQGEDALRPGGEGAAAPEWMSGSAEPDSLRGDRVPPAPRAGRRRAPEPEPWEPAAREPQGWDSQPRGQSLDDAAPREAPAWEPSGWDAQEREPQARGSRSREPGWDHEAPSRDAQGWDDDARGWDGDARGWDGAQGWDGDEPQPWEQEQGAWESRSRERMPPDAPARGPQPREVQPREVQPREAQPWEQQAAPWEAQQAESPRAPERPTGATRRGERAASDPVRDRPTDKMPRVRNSAPPDVGLTAPIQQQRRQGVPKADEPELEDGGPPTQASTPLDLDDHPAGLGGRGRARDADHDGYDSGEMEPVDAPDEPGERGRIGKMADSAGQAWAGVLAQWIIGAVGGAALWVGFRYLWRSLPVVALAAAVLVTVGLVVVVRALLRNNDLRTTLFAVLVGLLLTVSPAILVLLGR